MLKLAINTVGEELEVAAEFCRQENIGLEITDFAFPKNLEGDQSARIERHQKAVDSISPLISHGPLFDLIATSPDHAIVEITKQRHSTALEASVQVGVEYYVAHTQYTPMIRDNTYRKNWPTRMIDFWLPFADKAGKNGITICLENLWEPEPEIQANLIEKANHPHFRATFDNGHVLVFSKRSTVDWIKTLGSSIAHCHLHDNHGEIDEHLPVGDGIEDWPAYIEAIKKHAPDVVLSMESDKLVRNKQSIRRLKDL